MTKKKKLTWLTKLFGTILFFGGIFFAVYVLSAKVEALTTDAQKIIFPVGFAILISGLSVLWLIRQTNLLGDDEEYTRSYFPIFSGLLALICMVLAYVFIGMWPVGTKSAMIVDMHHQYAPLLAQLRDTLLHGDSFLYSFDFGLGASYLPLAGYYLASPLNFILLLFPSNLLDSAILVITIIKNMLSATFFAMALQYIYKKRTYAIPVVSVMFSMMMYLIAYSWNIMWLDVVMVLPLCLMGLEMLIREKKALLYVISLAYALFVNYYIAFMLCVFLALYYVARLISSDNGPKAETANFFRFGGYSILAAMLAAIMLLPVAASLGQTSAADGGFSSWKTNFDFLELLGRHLYDVTPTIRSGNLPNIYCGMLAVFAVPIFATTKSISGRRRAGMIGLLAVMAVSMVINNFDLFWHGLHSPNDLPYRFSFLYSVVLVLITYEALLHIREWETKQIGLSVGAIALYIFLEEKLGDDTYDFKSLYISLGLVVLYALVSAIIRNKKMILEAGYGLLLSVVVLEMVTASCGTFTTLNENEYFTQHNDYTDNSITKVVASSVEEMEKLGDKEAGEFYRCEVLPRRTCADTALFDYNGISIFASSNSYEETRFMGSLGYAVNGVNSFLYHAFVPTCDDLLGIRYVAMDEEFTAPEQLTERLKVEMDGHKYTIYENKDALSVAYFAEPELKSFTYNYYSPFESNNTLLSYMTGNFGSAYEFEQVSAGADGGSVTGQYSVSVPSGTSTFEVHPSRNGRMYLYIDCRAAKNLSATAFYTSRGDESKYWSCAAYEPYIFDCGDMTTGDYISVSIEAESSCGGNVYACMLDDSVYAEEIATLKQNQMNVSKFTDTKVVGTMVAPRDGCVFTSIPYDTGWTVKVDGKKVETFDAGKAMLAFDIAAGSHDITFTFFPRGLALGITLTVIAILALIFIGWVKRHPAKLEQAKRKIARKFAKKKAAPVAEKAAEVVEGTPVEEIQESVESTEEKTETISSEEIPTTPEEEKEVPESSKEEEWFE